MSAPDPKALLQDVFLRLYGLQGPRFTLGIGELLAAYQAVDGGWETKGAENLRQLGRLLWCHSSEEVIDFEECFDAALVALTPPDSPPVVEPALPERLPPPVEPPIEPPPLQAPPRLPPAPPEPAPLPVRTPARPPPGEPGPELRAYWPVSRRSMIYTWRYLRRPVKDGPRDVLDVETTVEQTARQGFFLRPVYDRRENNYAHLVLLVDQGGSMVPFHRFTRDLVETATDEEESQIRQVEVMYFHNVPPADMFRDSHLTQPLPLEQVFARLTPDTSVLLVSDAGAARGHRSMPRIRDTTEFLVRLKRLTRLIAWLNPMPQPRWAGTSAQYIARLAPMFQMDRDGFSHAVDALRGQSPHSRP